MKVWVLKQAILMKSHSARLRAWADTEHNVWVPGFCQGEQRMEEDGSLFYGVKFQPNPGFGTVFAWCNSEAVNVDAERCKELIRHGLPLTLFRQVKDLLTRVAVDEGSHATE